MVLNYTLVGCPWFLVTFIGLFRSSCYFNLNFLLCKCRGLPRSTPVGFPVMRRWKCLGVKRSSQQSSITPGKRAEKTWRRGSRRDASNAKSGKSLFHFKPEKVNKFEYCNNLWKQNIFRNPVRKLKTWLKNNLHAVCATCMQIFV